MQYSNRQIARFVNDEVGGGAGWAGARFFVRDVNDFVERRVTRARTCAGKIQVRTINGDWREIAAGDTVQVGFGDRGITYEVSE